MQSATGSFFQLAETQRGVDLTIKFMCLSITIIKRSNVEEESILDSLPPLLSWLRLLIFITVRIELAALISPS